MSRLFSELQRLYAADRGAPGAAPDTARATAPPETAPPAAAPVPPLVDARGRVRALVLELARPADWTALSAVWHGVQVDLALPPPAIAVNGRDGYQLWFSLAEPLPAAQAAHWLAALCRRYLGEVDARRLACFPAIDGDAPAGPRHAVPVPAPQAQPGRWSAFVAPDLAAVFADEPWLEGSPNLEGQAELLSRLASIAPEDLQRALDRLTPAATVAATDPPTGAATGVAAAARPAAAAPLAADPACASARGPAAPPGGWQDPRDFLRAVMNDAAAPLGQRIEAARALLAGPAR